MNDNVSAILGMMGKGNGESGPPDAVRYSAQSPTTGEQAQARTNIGIDLSAYELKPTVEGPTGASVTITPADNTVYNCGELTSLTISSPPATGSYVIKFTSGSTATVCNWSTIRWPGDVAPTIEANTEYEINVSDNKGVYNEGWPVPAPAVEETT